MTAAGRRVFHRLRARANIRQGDHPMTNRLKASNEPSTVLTSLRGAAVTSMETFGGKTRSAGEVPRETPIQTRWRDGSLNSLDMLKERFAAEGF
jgi:hypothetical protein